MKPEKLLDNPTVQELIDALMLIEDKGKKIVIEDADTNDHIVKIHIQDYDDPSCPVLLFGTYREMQ